MSAPAAADYAASRSGGIKVAFLAVIGMAAMVAVYSSHHHGPGIAIGVATFACCWLEGLPKARRARRRFPQ